ncbi:MAG: hypothetical protein MI810_25135 [Flavobacteriales bacterium]|jgi:hypothetical protein|nr:hypothetical protein [Flavobacteriales bacterium]
MAINLDVSFEIHNIAQIHTEEDEVKRNLILEATNQFIKDEELPENEFIVDFLGQDGFLAAYTTGPIKVSKGFDWLDEASKRWNEMAHRVLGADCQPKVEIQE